MAATLALGLAVDVRTGIAGQVAVGVAFWAVLFAMLRRVDDRERQALIACLAIATAAELVLSLGWGLYRYRLDNVPLFVPPGHVLMFLLGTFIARRMREDVARVIVAGAALYGVLAAAAGLDTLSLLFLAMLGTAWFFLPRERRLLASTFVLALGLELYGTWLGNWTWARTVPYTGWATTNPPGISGALYSTLDALVAGASILLARADRKIVGCAPPPSP
jgi:hypothetical protein